MAEILPINSQSQAEADPTAQMPVKFKIKKSECGKFEYIQPESTFLDKIDFKAPPPPDPVEAANHQIDLMQFEFDEWAGEARAKLNHALEILSHADLADGEIQKLERAILAIKGESETFGFETAGNIASSLTLYIESNPEWATHPDFLRVSIHAIKAALSKKAKSEAAKFAEIENAIGVAVRKYARPKAA